jgi:hypothetical protein
MTFPSEERVWLPPIRLNALFTALILLFSVPFTSAQVSTRIATITPTEASSNTPLSLKAELHQGERIERVYLVYRPFGESEYNSMEMDIVWNTASVTIPANEVIPPFIEYYLVLATRSGTLETFPLSEAADPFSTQPGKTLQVPVHFEDQSDSQVLFLSPEPFARLPADDILISVSLLRADTIVVKRATQLLLDGVDITSDAVISDDIIVYAPENFSRQLSPGSHKVTVRLFNRYGNLHHTANLVLTVTGQVQYTARLNGDFHYGASVQLESRRERVSNLGTWYNRGSVQFTGKTGEWQFTSKVFLTSDEKSVRQPQNRYYGGVESSWLRAGYGDSYPSFPNLILSGKRLRGFTSSIKLGFFKLDLAAGKTTRAVDGSVLKQFPLDSLAVEQQRDSTAAYGQIDAQTWGKFSYGTYARNLFVIRPRFDINEHWQFGFTALKSKDDVSSITFGIRPQENIVVGTDFSATFDQKRIDFSGQAAFSAFNSDISSNTFTDEHIDSTYKDDGEEIKKVRDILDSFITVNDNLRPLSLKKLSTFAYDLSLGLNYFSNALKFSYLFRGSDYNSFGQTFLRKDIQGFNISDRIGVANNQIFFTLSFEHLKDNTSDVKIATTSFLNYNLAVSYYPRINGPNVTVGFARYTTNNRLSVSGPDSLSVLDDGTSRFFLQSSYNYELGAKHTASFNISTSSRNDESLRRYDVNNVTLAFGLNTRYGIPLQTRLDFSTNFNELPSNQIVGETQRINYSTLSVNAKYSILQETISFIATASPTFGDFKRMVLDIGTQVFILPTMSILVQFSSFDNHGIPNDNFWGVQYRYDL